MNERIKQARHALGLTQQKFAERIGLKQNSIALIESGKRNISDQAILSICREYKINEEWLRNGIGEMFTPDDDELDNLVKKYNLSDTDQILIRKFVNMSSSERKAILHFLAGVANTLGITENAPEK